MRFVSLVEGATLLLLVCVAVPLKHLAAFPPATRLMGPVHGVAFVLYTWMLRRRRRAGRAGEPQR
ncbi:DUF3817 domain-containing protein [Burkholderia sp. 22PA0106]|uniref:DUF3817 domain-containing protein n=1 Tax=Burkholderia sp. 22PA0106 TaxID=3237371 RepID=UPI0039C089E4